VAAVMLLLRGLSNTVFAVITARGKYVVQKYLIQKYSEQKYLVPKHSGDRSEESKRKFQVQATEGISMVDSAEQEYEADDRSSPLFRPSTVGGQLLQKSLGWRFGSSRPKYS
jgi:hypothetical protein